MPSFCAIPNCENKYNSCNPLTSYHKFPFANAEMLEKWTAFVAKERNHTWRPSRWSSLCNKHFLPEDYKDQSSEALRKHLRAEAFPTLLSKRSEPLPEPTITSPTPDIIQQECNRICRLCGQNTTDQNSVNLHGNMELLALVVKYLPDVNVDNSSDILPKEICLDKCYEKLQSFAEFVENVKNVQEILRHKFYDFNDRPLESNGRMFKIKQEPIVKIKEEKIPINFNYSTSSNIDEFDPNFNQHLLNCDDFFDMSSGKMMEITDLSKVFIDLAENLSDDDEPMDNPELSQISKNNNKIEIISSIPMLKKERLNEDDVDFHDGSSQTGEILNEHSYSKSPIGFDQLIPCKTEDNENFSMPKIHIIDYSFLKHKCVICSALFETMPGLIEHQKQVHQKQFSCPKCLGIWTDFRQFYKHKAKCLNGAKVYKITSHFRKCAQCHVLFKSGQGYKNHSLSRCAKFRRQKSALNAPKETLAPPEDTKTDLRPILADHSYQRRFPGIGNYWAQGFVCHCGKQFGSVKGLRTHELRLSHAKPLACSSCDKSFRCLSNLNQHKLTHQTERAFSCDKCPKVFKRRGALDAHNKNIHLHIRPFQCQCLKTFALKADMKRCKHVKKNNYE